MRTVASFQWGGTSILARRLTILKVYRLLGILKIKVLEFKVKILKVFTIKFRKHRGAAGALADICADAPLEGRRKYPRRPPPRLRRGTLLAMG